MPSFTSVPLSTVEKINFQKFTTQLFFFLQILAAYQPANVGTQQSFRPHSHRCTVPYTCAKYCVYLHRGHQCSVPNGVTVHISDRQMAAQISKLIPE